MDDAQQRTENPTSRGDGAFDPSAYVRRARRLADLSQRDLAEAIDVTPSTIARIESGQDVGVRVFARMLALADLRLAIVDAAGAEVAPMPDDVFRDRAGRRQPAHLDVHAKPERPTIKMLFRSVDPVTGASWFHRRDERDRLRARAGSGWSEQLTTSEAAARTAAWHAARRDRATTGAVRPNRGVVWGPRPPPPPFTAVKAP